MNYKHNKKSSTDRCKKQNEKKNRKHLQEHQHVSAGKTTFEAVIISLVLKQHDEMLLITEELDVILY